MSDNHRKEDSGCQIMASFLLPSAEDFEKKETELKTYLRLWNTPATRKAVFDKTNIGFTRMNINDKAIKPMLTALLAFMANNQHKVDGTANQWCAGFCGSRWADITLAGKKVRLAFYSRKYDPGMFDSSESDGYDYLLLGVDDYFADDDC